MTRSAWEQYILETYTAEADHPWPRDPDSEVFRHPASRKWFALMMVLPRRRLGLTGDGTLTVLNLKGDPLLIGALRQEPGFFPAYHMNREHCLTVALDGTVEDSRIMALLDMSWQATAGVQRRK